MHTSSFVSCENLTNLRFPSLVVFVSSSTRWVLFDDVGVVLFLMCRLEQEEADMEFARQLSGLYDGVGLSTSTLCLCFL